MRHRLISFWTRLNLAQQFALASFVVLLAGMLAIGSWVSKEIEAGVIRHTALAAALYLNSSVAPEVQELAHTDRLSAKSLAELDHLYRETPLGKRVRSFKIWNREGRVIYSSNPEIMGQVFPVKDEQALAWDGVVTAEFSSLEHAENALERDLHAPLLEIYSPVRERWTDRLIAVAEFYDDASALNAQLARARAESWLVVASVTLLMFAALFGIVRRGSQTIVDQREELRDRVHDLSTLLSQNQALQARIKRASNKAVEMNERFLRRIGAELHDGPAQALGFALLRLEAQSPTVSRPNGGQIIQPAQNELEKIRTALSDALREIRTLSAGLTLPELADLTLGETIAKAVRSHQRRTGSEVGLHVDAVPTDTPVPLKIAVYRFVQEALNNGYRHGSGAGQQVQAHHAGTDLEVEVSDAGPGFDPERRPVGDDRLGLSAMQERIESLGGRFELDSATGHGTRVTAHLSTATRSPTDV